MSGLIAGYELLEELGRNAWGESYRARQISLDRVVHLTILGTEEECGGILPLARVCAAITHPNLVSGIDLGEHEGRQYLVTEWVEGPNVGEVVRRGGPIAEERALQIAHAGAQALDHAARKGLVHGHVTPAALLIARGGTPKLRGFGADRDTAHSERDYRSPEQKRGEVTDVRSDIYSLGMVLYLMLSGRHAFDDAPPASVVGGEVVEIPFPLTDAVRKLHPDTYEVAGRLMAWRLTDRLSSAGEAAERIEAVLEKLDTRASVPRARAARAGGRRPKAGPRPGRRRRRRRR